MEIKKKFDEMSVLSPLLFLYTLVYLGMMIGDFAAREKFDMPSGMMAVYIALVGSYAADKEIRRWMGKELPPKMGSIFVYLWLLFFLVAFVIRSFFQTFTIPGDLTPVALQVLGVFFGSYLAIFTNPEGSTALSSFRINSRSEDRFLPFGFVG